MMDQSSVTVFLICYKVCCLAAKKEQYIKDKREERRGILLSEVIMYSDEANVHFLL